MQLLACAGHILEQEEAAGHELERVRWQRYDLKVCGGVSAGLREDGAIVRLSGATAQAHWRELIPYARNVSRLDVQVTTDMGPGHDRMGAQHLRAALHHRRTRGGQWRVSFQGGPSGVETVYLGRRTSETFARLYNKYAESEDPRWLHNWRYEVEVKKPLAVDLARFLYHHSDPQLACQLYVYDYFSARGVKPAYACSGSDVQLRSHRDPTSAERTLRWWDEQVAGVYARLAPKVGDARLLAALGARGEGPGARDPGHVAGGPDDGNE